MEAKRFLEVVGEEVSNDFVKNRSILSFEEYLNLFSQNPRQQARNAAMYLKDAIDAFGSELVAHPAGKIRRFKIFDRTDGERGDGRVAGQEEVQNAIYRLISNFVRAGRINKLILLHGPNGSAKSTLVDALKRGMEAYSRTPAGALYKLNWIFPSEKLVKGSIGFGDKLSSKGELTTFAHLDADSIDVRLSCEMRDHPLFVVPHEQRRKLLEQAIKGGEAREETVLPDYLLEGELCHKCRKIYSAILAANGGDYLKVLRHVQVERFYISRRYLSGTSMVEPQMSVDAAYHQVTADRSQMNLPPALHNIVLFQPHGALVSANRGLIEYSDLLKRPLEAFKYLLGASETGEVPLEHFVLQLDEVLIASANEKHLAAFKELPDFASFKGRIELVRVPYLRRWRVEAEIYTPQVTSTTVGKHVAPHAIELAAIWAVLTRLKKPIPDRYPAELKEIVDHLTPLEKLALYAEGAVPDRLAVAQAKELRKHIQDIYEESDAYPNYEGRTGASAREIKTALFNAAQSPSYACLNALAVLEELEALCKDKSVYEFLQQEVVDGYHDHEEFVRVAEKAYLDRVDEEVRESMGLISEGQYRELFERYVQHVSHWVKGEKMRNRITGEMERPDESRMSEMEGIVMPKGEDSGDFRRALISQIGAHKLDNPDAEMDYPRIFPDLFRRLRDHFYEERKRVLHRNEENILKYLSEDRGMLTAREQQQVEATLKAMSSRYGYCNSCAKDAILFLMRKRCARPSAPLGRLFSASVNWRRCASRPRGWVSLHIARSADEPDHPVPRVRRVVFELRAVPQDGGRGHARPLGACPRPGAHRQADAGAPNSPAERAGAGVRGGRGAAQRLGGGDRRRVRHGGRGQLCHHQRPRGGHPGNEGATDQGAGRLGGRLGGVLRPGGGGGLGARHGSGAGQGRGRAPDAGAARRRPRARARGRCPGGGGSVWPVALSLGRDAVPGGVRPEAADPADGEDRCGDRLRGLGRGNLLARHRQAAGDRRGLPHRQGGVRGEGAGLQLRRADAGRDLRRPQRQGAHLPRAERLRPAPRRDRCGRGRPDRAALRRDPRRAGSCRSTPSP